MKTLIPLLLLSALLPTAASADTHASAENPDSLSLLLRDFEAEFARTQQTLRSNVPPAPGDIRTVYDLYRELSDEQALLARGVIRTRRTGRYATAQERISFYPLPADSTLRTVEAYLLAPESGPESAPDADVGTQRTDLPAPLPESLREVDMLLQGPPRGLKRYVVSNFRPELKVPADSVIYLTPALQEKLTACLKMAWERGLPEEAMARIHALMPVKRGTWGGLRIVKPIVVNYILLESGPDASRAYVSVLNDDAEVHGLLFVRDAAGRWRLRAARMLGQIIAQ